MSDILIKGVEMPVTCCHCPLMGYDPDREWYDSMARTGAHICVLTGELIDNTKREEHCPLVPVPPHGRLIDEKDIVPKDGYIIADGMACIPVKDIINAPTIIPAEEGET